MKSVLTQVILINNRVCRSYKWAKSKSRRDGLDWKCKSRAIIMVIIIDGQRSAECRVNNCK